MESVILPMGEDWVGRLSMYYRYCVVLYTILYCTVLYVQRLNNSTTRHKNGDLSREVQYLGSYVLYDRLAV